MVVAIIFFDRPDLLSGALENIRLFPLSRFHAVSDGSRADDTASRDRVDTCRRMVEEFSKGRNTILHYSTKNLGCQQRILTGLDEVFRVEKEAVLLEDDIRYDESFVRYCQTGLECFRGALDVGSVCGKGFPGFHKLAQGPVCRSIYSGSWGWATWRDRWQKFRADNLELKILDHKESPAWLRMEKKEWLFWQDRIGKARSRVLDSWAYPWQAFCWQSGWWTLRPSANLTVNVGFRSDATHTKEPPPGIVGKIQPWSCPDLETMRCAPERSVDPILSDWIRPGAMKLTRRLNRFIRGWR